MSDDLTRGRSIGTGAEAYDAFYYAHACGDAYDWRSPEWRKFFDGMADRLVLTFSPRTTLDAGCAKGMLVGALAERGIDARGIDISPTAIAQADPRAHGRVGVASLTEPVEGRYDLVTCIEVIEHLSQPDAERALDHLCAVTDLIVISSSPWDFKEATHVNVRPGGHWAAMLFDRGFVRRFDVDLGYITPWAVAYERRTVATRSIVSNYEDGYVWLRSEVADKRQAQLDMQSKLARAEATANRVEEASVELLKARDAARGWEQTAGTASRRADRLQREVDRLHAELEQAVLNVEAIQQSRTWRAGRFVTAPGRFLRRLVRGV